MANWMNEKSDRIADALERIADALERMSPPTEGDGGAWPSDAERAAFVKGALREWDRPHNNDTP